MLITPTLEELVFLTEVVRFVGAQGESVLHVWDTDGDRNESLPVPHVLRQQLHAFCETHGQVVVRAEPPAGDHWKPDDYYTNLTWSFHADGRLTVSIRVEMVSSPIEVLT